MSDQVMKAWEHADWCHRMSHRVQRTQEGRGCSECIALADLRRQIALSRPDTEGEQDG